MGHVDVVKLLLERPIVDPTAKNNGVIRDASLMGHADVVKLLLERSNVDPATRNNEAIGNASANGHVDVVKQLLGHPGVAPAAEYNVAIRSASKLDTISSMLTSSNCCLRVQMSTQKMTEVLPGKYHAAQPTYRTSCRLQSNLVNSQLSSCYSNTRG